MLSATSFVRRRVAMLALASALFPAVLVARSTSAVAAVVAPVHYEPPVQGQIIDPYRPPGNPYGAGNRGVDIATQPGAVVRAPADGVVSFAGQVGGDLFVVIAHADGVRTTLGFLATVSVRAGRRVQLGEPVGTSGGVVHFGARRGAVYIDPLSLLSAGQRVRLVPVHPGTLRSTGLFRAATIPRPAGTPPSARSG